MSDKKISAVSLGNTMFLPWTAIDTAADRWAKAYFGPHVIGTGCREETDFELGITLLKPSDYEKFARLFEKYDQDRDYEPEDEFSTGNSMSVIPVAMTRAIMRDALYDPKLRAYGTTVAIEQGVFFMELDRHNPRHEYELSVQTPMSAEAKPPVRGGANEKAKRRNSHER